MDLITVFFSTLFIVGIGELGDKTQIATGTSALAHKENTRIIFLSSASALIFVAGITVFSAGFIPEKYTTTLVNIGGFLLIVYGLYLLLKNSDKDDDTNETNNESTDKLKLFTTNFLVVFFAELGDKTQIATLAIAIENQAQLFVVFLASATALTLITYLTTWGITKIPEHWIGNIQKLGAVLLILYGIYMLT